MSMMVMDSLFWLWPRPRGGQEEMEKGTELRWRQWPDMALRHLPCQKTMRFVKAPCGGEIAGRFLVDRGKQGTKRSVMTDGHGIPLRVGAVPANRNDSPLLAPTLEKLAQFGDYLPEQITVHLDAGYDSGKTRALLTT